MLDECVTTKPRLDWWVNECRKAGVCAFDTETTGLRVVQGYDDIVGISLAISPEQGCYIPIMHRTGEEQLSPNTVLDTIKPLCEDPDVLKVLHNSAFDIGVLDCYGIKLVNYDDTLLMSYCLDGQKDIARGHSFDALVKHHFKRDTIKFQDVVIPELGIRDFADVQLLHATAYASEDSRETLRLYHHLIALLEGEVADVVSTDLMTTYEVIDRPLPRVTSDMKFRGVMVDQERLADLDTEFKDKLCDLEDQIYDEAGYEFNVGSNKELAKVLFEELKLDPPKETDSGQASVAKDALAELKNDHPIVPLLLEHSKYSTLISLVTSNWPQHISPYTGRMHGNFNVTSTNTRRLSGGDPNLQNVPTRSDEGAELRKCVVAPKGRALVVQDMSQIEYRLLAHTCGAKPMRKAFIDGFDFHEATAKMIGVERAQAKNVNFAMIYGAGPKKIAAMCGFTEKQAYRVLDEYSERFPEVDEWKNDVKAYARQHGYVETMFGARIHVPFIRWSDKAMQAYGERQAVNGVIQGTAADMMRLSMASVHRALKKYKDAWLLLSVHDELVVECYEDDAPAIAKLMERLIVTCADEYIKWSIPIKSDGGYGESWGTAKKK